MASESSPITNHMTSTDHGATPCDDNDNDDDNVSEVCAHFEDHKSPYCHRKLELQIVSVETLVQDMDQVPLAFISPVLSTIVYHGTQRENLVEIVKKGFDIKKLGQHTGNRGYIGAGIYSSTNPSVATEYASGDHGDTIRVIACKALLGKPFHLEWRTDLDRALGMKLEPGYDSHILNHWGGEEVCIFDARRIRPWWILTLKVVEMTEEAWKVAEARHEDRWLRFRTGPHANKPLQQILTTHPTYLHGFANNTSHILQGHIKRILAKECLL